MLWSAYKDAYLGFCGLHGGTRNVEKARDVLGRFTRYTDPVTLEEISNQTFVRYLTRRKKDRGRDGKPLSAATLNGDIRYLNAAFSAALPADDQHPDRLGVVDDHSWRPPRMRLVRELRTRPRCYSQDSLARIFDACELATTPQLPGCPAALWWRAFFALAYLTGVRCKALLELPRPSKTDLCEGVLRVPAESDKSDGERSFCLTLEGLTLISRLPVSPDGRLFAWPFCRRYFYTVLHRFQTLAGIPVSAHGLPHDLRRTKGTELVKMGCPLPLVQRELGHTSSQVTERYYIGEISQAQRTAVAALPIPDSLRRRVHTEERQLCLF